MTRTNTPARPVTVIGLGSMGIALAHTLLRAGVPTTVWNRTPGRAAAVEADGAAIAPDFATAVAAADLLVVCLRDHDVVRTVLGGLTPAAYSGRTVINLSSSTPGEGRHTAAWAAERGIFYLTGAIMVPTPLIGGPDALILYSGDRSVFDRHMDELRHLAGQTDYLGSDPGLAGLYDVAMLEIFFAGMTSFLHAAAMVTAQGLDAKTFLPYAQQIVSLLPATFDGLAEDVDNASYPGAQDNLAMELAALKHIADTSAEIGLDSGLPNILRDLARRAVDAGNGADSYSRLIETIRGNSNL